VVIVCADGHGGASRRPERPADAEQTGEPDHDR
jgi:hypothetical protein